jgi:predicted secreted hydrolase
MRTLTLLCCSIALGLASAAEWLRVESPPALSWPRDHAAHSDYRTEWWYATGTLASDDGRSFGYQLTFFRRGMAAQPSEASSSTYAPEHVLAAHLAVVDLRGARLHQAERMRRIGAGLASAAEHELELVLDDFELRRDGGGVLHLLAHDRDAGIGLELQLESSKPLVLHGERGLSRKGPEPGNASVYVSWTRLATRGTLHVGGVSVSVSGESWFDHEWGSSQLGAGVVGWDWFGLRLDDGRELMLYRMRDAQGGASAFSAGTLVEQDGSTRALSSKDFEMQPLSRWKSPRSGAEYPARWKVAVPKLGLAFEIAPLVDDCEIDGRASSGVVYWEGPVTLSAGLAGTGYGEFVGYAHEMRGRF